MSDFSNEISSFFPQRSCECYKKLQTYGIPLYISDENDFYSENQKKIIFENAFELPGDLEINEEITEYLVVEDNELFNVFNHMVEVIPGLSNFEQNVLNFWILDMFIEGLWTAQNEKLNFKHQKATLLWIAYSFNYIQKQNPSRKKFFDHLKKVIFRIRCRTKCEDTDERSGESNRKISDNQDLKESIILQQSTLWDEKGIWKLPLPPKYDKNSKKYQNDEIKESGSREYNSAINEPEAEVKSSHSYKSTGSDQIDITNESAVNLKSMKIILGILYRIFGRLWVFLEIQTVFHAMPSIKQVDLPLTLKIPKPLMKPETPVPIKTEKIEKLGRRHSYSEKSFEEAESERQQHKNDFIFPLQNAEESKFILKQFLPHPSSQRSILDRKNINKI